MLWALMAILLVIVPLWRICSRAGFSGALSLLVCVPWIGIVVIAAILSFVDWPSKARPVRDQ